MKFAIPSVVFACFLFAGCGEPPAKSPVTPAPPPVVAPGVPDSGEQKQPADTVTMPPTPLTPGGTTAAAAAPSATAPEGFTPVPLEAGVAKVSADNSTIQFVGKHVEGGENDPQARTGVFEKLTGQVVFDPATMMLKSATAEIDATSLFVPIQQLQDHLKSQDFLSVREFPTIKFQTTRIEPAAEAGKVNITGDLTLHGVTKSITIPATLTASRAGVTIDSEFKIARADFGMTGQERVQPIIQLKVMVGKKTERPARGGRRRNTP
ncbi:MAG: YceI family protein [Pirellulales bacterium]